MILTNSLIKSGYAQDKLLIKFDNCNQLIKEDFSKISFIPDRG